MPDCRFGSKLLNGLLVVVRAVSHETLHVPAPHGTRCRTPVDENQSLHVDAGVAEQRVRRRRDVARPAERRREHRRVGAAALADVRRLDLGVEPDDRQIRVVLDGALRPPRRA